MKRILFIIMAFVAALNATAQSADKLYSEGKAFYDAKNYAAALPPLKAAAEKGHRKAQYRLGRCYDKGHGTKENDKLAFEWYLKAAAQDYAKAQYEVGKCYKNGEGVEKDRRKAVEWFAKAARHDHAEAQLALGKSYMKGKGIAADQKKAKSWLNKAVSNPKGGDEVLDELRKEAAEGDEDAKAILTIVGKQ